MDGYNDSIYCNWLIFIIFYGDFVIHKNNIDVMQVFKYKSAKFPKCLQVASNFLFHLKEKEACIAQRSDSLEKTRRQRVRWSQPGNLEMTVKSMLDLRQLESFSPSDDHLGHHEEQGAKLLESNAQASMMRNVHRCTTPIIVLCMYIVGKLSLKWHWWKLYIMYWQFIKWEE